MFNLHKYNKFVRDCIKIINEYRIIKNINDYIIISLV